MDAADIFLLEVKFYSHKKWNFNTKMYVLMFTQNLKCNKGADISKTSFGATIYYDRRYPLLTYCLVGMFSDI